MISLIFFETGEKTVLNCDLTLFSNVEGETLENCETIVLDGIDTKHCAIVKKDHVFKIIDLCSSGTKLYINDQLFPFILKPLKNYELRDKDRIYIGKHEIMFCNEPCMDQNEKRSFYIPETQPSFETEETNNLNEEDHIEIPETQCMETENGLDQMIDDILEPKVQNTEKSEYEVETQPALNILPRFTRSRKQKQDLIKPRTVPVSLFDCSSAFTAETQDYVPVKRQRSKFGIKRRTESKSGSSSKQVKLNSILLSEEEKSDTDDERGDVKVINLDQKKKFVPEDNSLNITITDDLGMDKINSAEFDSQFLLKLNGSNYDENYDCDLKTASNTDKYKKEEICDTSSIIIKRDDEVIEARPKKKYKLFKYAIDDGDDLF